MLLCVWAFFVKLLDFFCQRRSQRLLALVFAGLCRKDGWLHQLIRKATPAVGAVLIDHVAASCDR